MKLNLGCGLDFREGYLNIDIQDVSEACPKPCQFRQCDCKKLSFAANGSVEEIVSNHFLEHVHPLDIKEVLAEWRRVLPVGGILRIVFPDFEKVVTAYDTCKGLETLDRFMQYLSLNYVTLCSSQGDRVETLYPHKSLLTTRFLTVLLESEGFTVRGHTDSTMSTEIVAERITFERDTKGLETLH